MTTGNLHVQIISKWTQLKVIILVLYQRIINVALPVFTDYIIAFLHAAVSYVSPSAIAEPY
jgi:hypothetical protein